MSLCFLPTAPLVNVPVVVGVVSGLIIVTVIVVIVCLLIVVKHKHRRNQLTSLDLKVKTMSYNTGTLCIVMPWWVEPWRHMVVGLCRYVCMYLSVCPSVCLSAGFLVAR